MGRRLKIDRPRRLEAKVPSSVYDKFHAELYSEIEGRVPFNAQSLVVTQLLIGWLRERGVEV